MYCSWKSHLIPNNPFGRLANKFETWSRSIVSIFLVGKITYFLTPSNRDRVCMSALHKTRNQFRFDNWTFLFCSTDFLFFSLSFTASRSILRGSRAGQESPEATSRLWWSTLLQNIRHVIFIFPNSEQHWENIEKSFFFFFRRIGT